MSRIITFYSYKGGVGRTFALANIAVLLAKRGKRVLLMDWDLEAPGLERYFKPYHADPFPDECGTIHMLQEATRNPKASWESHTRNILVSSATSLGNPQIPLTIMPSGEHSPHYGKLVRKFSWDNFFEKQNGGSILERWRNEWRELFDFVLIDSRTGITDVGGICTILLPDFLVLVFSTNDQSFEGALGVAQSAQLERQKLQVPRPPMPILPLLSHFDGREEIEIASKWLQRFARDLKPLYDDWLPKDSETLKVIELTKIPYVSRFSFGETIPVITHSISDPELPGFYFEHVTRILASDFADVSSILGTKPSNQEIPLDSPTAIFHDASVLIRNRDLNSWRRTLAKKMALLSNSLQTWRKEISTSVPQKKSDLIEFGYSALSNYQQVFAMTLAGLESGVEGFNNQRKLLYDLRKPLGWDGSGYSIVVSLPDLAAFSFQALAGAMCIHTRQTRVAIDLATQRTESTRGSKSVPLFLNHELNGWPESLGHDSSISWDFLWKMPDKFEWLVEAFGSKRSFREALVGYFLVLSWLEFIELLRTPEQLPIPAFNNLRLDVPPFFLLREELAASIRLILEDSKPLREYTSNVAVDQAKQMEYWPNWLSVCRQWLISVDRSAMFYENRNDVNHFVSDIFQ